MIGSRVGSRTGSILSSSVGSGVDDEGAGLPPDASGRRILAFAGQSNINGEAFLRTLSLADNYTIAFPDAHLIQKLDVTSPDPPTWLETSGVVEGPILMRPRTVLPPGSGGDHGPEQACMRYLNNTNPRGWHVIKYALGGSLLNTNWKSPGGVYPGTPPRLGDQFITFMQQAQTTLNSTIAAIVWEQGTSDALVTAAAAAYQTNLQNFYNYVSPSFPGKPWIIVQICSTSAGGADLTAVRNAEAAFVTAQNIAVPGSVALINAEGLPLPGLVANTTHYSADGYYVMGRRMAVQVLASLAIPEKPQANFRYFGTGLSTQFTDMTVNGNSAVNAWSWNFGDATALGTTQNPVHVYAAPGTYSVQLTATSANGLNSVVTRGTIVATTAWTIDATANKACPANLTESTAFHSAANPSSSTSGPPTSIWGMQENCQSTPFLAVDSINGINLAANGAFTSQAVVAGWSRVGNQWTDGLSNRHISNSTTAANGATTSMLLLGYWVMPAAAPATTRAFQFVGTTGNGDVRITNGTGKLQQNAALNTPTVYNVCDGGTQFVAVQSNLATGEATLYTEKEKFILPFRTPASAPFVSFGGMAALTPAATVVYGALYTGAGAEKTATEIREIARRAGFNPNW